MKKVLKGLSIFLICLGILYYTAKFFSIHGALHGIYTIGVPASIAYCACQNRLNTIKYGHPGQCSPLEKPSNNDIFKESLIQTFTTFP